MTSPCINERPTQQGISVTLPNRQQIQATHTCDLLLHTLPPGARHAHKFPHLAHPLLSISQLCDHGCIATFDSNQVRITHDDDTVLVGNRDPTTNLWTIPLQPAEEDFHMIDERMEDEGLGYHGFLRPQYHRANSAYHTTNQVEHVTFLHAACGYPVPTTWIKAIDNGHFATWPGLTADLVRKHLAKSVPTLKGHLHQQRQNIRSTQPTAPDDNDQDMTPPTDTPNLRTHMVYSAIAEPRHEIATDLTGRFPVTSSHGNKYILVCYVYDCNAILTAPLKNRTDSEHLRAFNSIHQYLVDRGFTPNHQRLDNEASTAYKSNLRRKGIDFQLVPPHNHRRNAAERAIQTFKNHFVAILCGTDKLFPLHLWCRLLPQATATLNLLRSSRLHPQLSAEAHLNGSFDFNRTPLAPLGTQVILHETPRQRTTWAPHGVDGWYIGYAPEHYRCYTIYVSKTHGTRVGSTVEFLPTQVTMPHNSSADMAARAALDLINALRNPTPAAPTAPLQIQQHQALAQLATIFASALAPAPSAPPRVPPATRPVPPRVAATTPTRVLQLRPVRPPPSPELIQLLARRPAPTTTAPATVRPTSPARRPQRPAIPMVTPPSRPHLRAPTPVSHAGHTPRTLFTAHKYPTRLQQANQPQSQANFVCQIDHTTTILPPNRSVDPGLSLANAVLHPDTGEVMEYRALAAHPKTQAIWTKSFANELGRLAQGVGNRITGTDTIFFIPKTSVPQDRTVTYGRIVCDYRPQKSEPERTRLTVGGNLINYPYDVSTDTSDLTTAKLVINNTVSTPGARHLLIDLKNYYLGTPMERYEYMRLAIEIIPDEIIQQYDLRPLVHNGYVYIEIRRGMYGLPQAGIIANNQLVERLAPFGYAPVTHTPGLWRHTTRPIMFSLVVDDFGISYVNRANAQHLIDTLASFYEITVDWEATKYCGITLEWDYKNRTVDLSMPNYVTDALHHFQHPVSIQPVHAPSK